VATPNGMHTQLVLDAAAAGKHIFCEKPLAFTVAECDHMIAAATRHGVRLMVGHVLRLLPLFSRVIELLDAGVVGEPCAATITRIGWFGDPTARYRLRKETTGGLLYDITVHEIDLLHRLFGPTQMVSATLGRTVLQTIDYEETAHLLLRFRSGATASLFESIASPLSESSGVILATRGRCATTMAWARSPTSAAASMTTRCTKQWPGLTGRMATSVNCAASRHGCCTTRRPCSPPRRAARRWRLLRPRMPRRARASPSRSASHDHQGAGSLTWRLGLRCACGVR